MKTYKGSKMVGKSNVERWLSSARIYLVAAVCLLGGGANPVMAKPRAPLPPAPDWGVLHCWQFDDPTSQDVEGANAFAGQFDEVCTFDHPCGDEEVAFNYRLTAPASRLGPITAREEAARREDAQRRRAQREAALAGQNEGAFAMANLSNCPTNGPAYLTNLVSTLSSNAMAEVTFDIVGGIDEGPYDIFFSTSLAGTNVANTTWTWLGQGDTCNSYTLTNQPATNAFYMLGSPQDSDFDGLPDAFEQLALHTNPLSADSNNNGIPDGQEDVNQNGDPDYAEYMALTRAVIYATDPVVNEGGGAGEIKILLPAPAPTNGTKIVLQIGGTAERDQDFFLTYFNGVGLTNDAVYFMAGERARTVTIWPINNEEQSSHSRDVFFTLAFSENYALDPASAKVTIMEDDGPTIAVFAVDPLAVESSGAVTNTGQFVFRRYGDASAPLTIFFAVTGSAQGGVDFESFAPSITLTASTDRATLDIRPLLDTAFEGDEDVVLTLAPHTAYKIHSMHATGRVTVKDDDLPVVTIASADTNAAEYGSDTGSITLQRNGRLTDPLTVTRSLSGTATSGVDFEAISNSVTFAPNASLAAVFVRPLTNAEEEAVETVVITVKGGIDFVLGGTNSARIWIDDASPTRFTLAPLKQSSVYNVSSPAIDSPAVVEIRRTGRSTSNASIPFVMTAINPNGQPVLTTGYRAYGDVAGTKIVFAPFATRARASFTSPAPSAPPPGDQFVLLQVPSLSPSNYPIFFLRLDQFVQFSVPASTAVEGTTTNALLRLSRLVTGPAMTGSFTVGGAADGPGDPLTIDHNFSSPFTMTIPANTLSIETNFAALADGYLEGWESVFITPVFAATNLSLDVQPPSVLFIREDVANPGALPGSDYDLDGLPDIAEVTHGFDPLTPGDGERDDDGDGLINMEEYEFGTNPRLPDTDGNGVDDFRQNVLASDPGPDYVPVSFYVHDTGKINNGQNCAVCHTTQLKAGDYSFFSRRSAYQEPAEKPFWYRKGQSYPIYLSEIVASLPPTTNTMGNPTTTAKYTAALVAPTNAPAAFVVQDPQHKLGTNLPWATFPANPSVAIGTLIVPRIEVSWEEAVGNAPLEPNPNPGVGWRVFPDRLSPNDSESRDLVFVNIKTTPPVPGTKVRLRVLDVDDASPLESDPNLLIDSTDIGGIQSGDDNRGTNRLGTLSDTVLTLDALGSAFTIFRVTLHPGDNFRIAAVLDTQGASNHLNQLQVDNEFTEFYVTPDTNQVPHFLGSLSPMLTVWRKLHLEFDSMTAPPASGPEENRVRGFIHIIKQNFPTAGRTEVRITHTNDFPASGRNLFEGGKLEVPGISAYRVVSWYSFRQGSRTVSWLGVEGMVPTNALLQGAVLYDDDDRYLANDPPSHPSLLGLPSPPLPVTSSDNLRTSDLVEGIRSRFGLAYILPLDANALNWNVQRTIPFTRNTTASLSGGVFDAGNQELNRADRPEFWAYTVVIGYQGGPSDDADSNTEALLLGVTIKKTPISANGYSVLYLETIRDRMFADESAPVFTLQSDRERLRAGYFGTIYNVLAHEVGHAPGNQGENADHAEKGLMASGPENNTNIFPGDGIPILRFAPITLKRFRSASRWVE